MFVVKNEFSELQNIELRGQREIAYHVVQKNNRSGIKTVAHKHL